MAGEGSISTETQSLGENEANETFSNPDVLLHHQADVIRSILTLGLKNAKDLEESNSKFVSSKDEELNDYIDGVVIDPHRDINDQLNEGLYGAGLAVFTVLAERRNERQPHSIPKELDASQKADYQERMQSSMLVITNNPEHHGAKMIAPNEIQIFCFPRTIYDSHKELIDNLVPSEKLIIAKTIQRRVRGVYMQQFEVPNYEQCIEDFQANENFFVSGVKLPTVKDIAG